MHKKLKNSLVRYLKNEFVSYPWWNKEVQPDVKKRVFWVIDNIEILGVSFQQTFLKLFQWEFERRKIEHLHLQQVMKNPMPGYLASLLGMRVSEETFQCGKLPTRVTLDLYDYIEPNDSDVSVCMLLCNRIQHFQSIALLPKEAPNLIVTHKEISNAFASVKIENVDDMLGKMEEGEENNNLPPVG